MLRPALVALALTALFSASGWSGESPYNPANGANAANVQTIKTCEPRINQASRKMVYMPEGEAKRQVDRELQLARSAMGQGQTAQCLEHAQKARALEP